MALTEGWKWRLERWQKAITDRIYLPLAPVKVAGFVLQTSLVLKHAAQTDLLENEPRHLPHAAGSIQLEFLPFEVKNVVLTVSP